MIPAFRNSINETSIKLIGKPYCIGGKGTECFDCSGFVFYVYKEVGLSIAKNTDSQIKEGDKIEKISDVKNGDILFFRMDNNQLHNGIYIGDNYFIHSPKKDFTVRKEKLNKFWIKRFIQARRIL